MRRKAHFAKRLSAAEPKGCGELQLDDGARVAVIGGGPAGSLFSHYLLRMAEVADLDLALELYEPRDFSQCGPCGCNHCGGIVSESLVQLLSADGINLPTSVVQRGIEYYVLHMDVGTVNIAAPVYESRIAAVYRGNGPRTGGPSGRIGFDQFLQEQVRDAGATIRRQLVDHVAVDRDGAQLRCADGSSERYDLVVLASGVNSNLIKQLAGSRMLASAPRLMKTFISEFHLGEERVDAYFGDAMHVFLLDLPRLQFAALVPKGAFVTMCLLGDDIDQALVQAFLDAPEVRACFPDATPPPNACFCFPRINVGPAVMPFGDRLVMVGDCGVSRLYKDGIGAAYRTAKAAASTAIFNGVGAADFRRYFWPVCRSIIADNRIGASIFAVAHVVQRLKLVRQTLHTVVCREQARPDGRRLSSIMWDLFTGSAPYTSILWRGCNPAMMAEMATATLGGFLPGAHSLPPMENTR